MSVVGEFQRAQATVCGYARRYLDELERLESGEGSCEATVLALELLRAASRAHEQVRQQLLTEVGG